MPHLQYQELTPCHTSNTRGSHHASIGPQSQHQTYIDILDVTHKQISDACVVYTVGCHTT